MKIDKQLVLRVLVLLLALAPCARVQAGGLYLFDRGARPLARGGAFVAGADDPGALWYNPAGLAEAKNQVLADFTLTFFMADFARLGPDGTAYEPTIKAEQMKLPIPTLAVSHDFGLEDFTFGFGIFAPNVVLLSWPDAVQGPNGPVPSPARYSLMSMKGSILSSLTVGMAYHGIPGLSIGADVQVTGGRFKATTALSGCDAFACAFPEDPDFDSIVTLDLVPVIAVSGAAGFTAHVGPLRFGGSVTFPYSLKGDAHLGIQLPNSPLFDNATVVGDTAEIEMKFPWIYRVGAEIRPVSFLRMEGAFVYEGWSVQDQISVRPKNVQMRDIRGIGNYDVGPTPIQRNMRDAWSVRGGYELFVPSRWILASTKLVLRGGLAYERGAFATSALTPLTLDSDKWVLSGGLGMNVADNVRLDSVIGWMFMANPKVRDSAIRKPEAIRPGSVDNTVLGNGDYTMEAVYIGGALVIDL